MFASLIIYYHFKPKSGCCCCCFCGRLSLSLSSINIYVFIWWEKLCLRILHIMNTKIPTIAQQKRQLIRSVHIPPQHLAYIALCMEFIIGTATTTCPMYTMQNLFATNLQTHEVVIRLLEASSSISLSLPLSLVCLPDEKREINKWRSENGVYSALCTQTHTHTRRLTAIHTYAELIADVNERLNTNVARFKRAKQQCINSKII